MRQATQLLMDAYNDNPYQSALVIVSLKNGTELTLTNADIMEDGLVIDRYSTYNDSVTFGTCVASELSLRLNNHDGRFDGVNFTGALIRVYIDINNTTSYRVTCGAFIVDGQPRNKSEIEITALDKMTLLDQPMTTDMFKWPDGSSSVLTYEPLGIMVRNVIWNCIGTKPDYFYNWPNGSYRINTTKLPYAEGVLTCRQFVSWAFALMGGFADIGYDRETVFHLWYETWDETDTSQVRYVCDASKRYSFDYSNNNITVSGLFYKGSDQSTTLVGQPDYAIDFTSNLLTSSLYEWNAYEAVHQQVDPYNVLVNIYNHRSGNVLSYMPFSATVRAAPFLWPGDPVELVTPELAGYDEDGEPIYVESHESTTITHVTYKLNGATYIAAEGQSPEEHQTVPTTGSGTTTGANILAGNLTVAGNASFSGDIAVPSSGLLKVVSTQLWADQSVASDSYLIDTYTVSAGDGWTPLGIVGYNINSHWIYVYDLRLQSATTVRCGVHNARSSAQTCSMTIRLLCVRTSL